jgi:hypothetical protein
MTDDTPAEAKFTWRRIYTYGSALLTNALLARVVLKIDGDEPLKWVALALIGANALREGFYMGGASVVDYAKLAASWKGKE